MTHLGKLLKTGISQLKTAGLDTPELDAELLLLHAANTDRETLRAHPETQLSPRQINEFEKLIQQRIEHVPVAYLTGHRGFYGLDFLVDKNVLIPRSETELLIDQALQILSQKHSKFMSPSSRNFCKAKITCPEYDEGSGTPKVASNINIADIGTGSGAIIISLAKTLSTLCHPGILRSFSEEGYPGPPKSRENLFKFTYHATDISQKALDIAQKNAHIHQAEINFLEGYLAEPLPGNLDLVISNPPYLTEKEMRNLQFEVQKEPRVALFGGMDGLDLYRELFEQLKNKMNPGGHILLEHGHSQAEALKKIAHQIWPDCSTKIIKDLAGKNRVTHIWNI